MIYSNIHFIAKLFNSQHIFTNQVYLYIVGGRSFSKWKGSAVDSVMGVLLTQNVQSTFQGKLNISDRCLPLSMLHQNRYFICSSAFMSLASRFPVQSKSSKKSYVDTNILLKCKSCHSIQCSTPPPSPNNPSQIKKHSHKTLADKETIDQEV